MDENLARRVADALPDRSTGTSSASSAEIPGSAAFDEAQVVDAIARAGYDDPVGHELPEAPPAAPPLAREGGLFRRFRLSILPDLPQNRAMS